MVTYSGLIYALTAVSLLATVVGVGLFVRGVVHIIRQVNAGAPLSGRWNHLGRRFAVMLGKAFSHRTFRGNVFIAAAHWLVAASFVLLIFTLVRAYGQLFDAHWNLPVLGGWPAWAWITDIMAWLGLVAIVALMLVRWWARRVPTSPLHTSRFFGSTNWQALFVEWVILLVCMCVLVLHSLDYALEVQSGPGAARLYYPFTWFVGEALVGAGLTASTLELLVVATCTVKIVVSMTWMAVVGLQTRMGVAWHRFLAPLNMMTGRHADGRKTLGALAEPTWQGDSIPDLDEALEADDFAIGLGTVSDLTWKDRLDFLTCTECGRCQDLCPAWNTGKPLSPKLLTLALRESIAGGGGPAGEAGSGGDGSRETTAGAGADGETVGQGMADQGTSPFAPDLFAALRQRETVGQGELPGAADPLVGDFLNPDVLWDCTMCGACVEQCPVDIEHVDRIANLRRFQVLMESAFPRELARPFKGMESKGNPYNMPARKRLDWAKDLDFEVPVIFEDVEDATEVEYLFWVGCAGAYDDKQKRVSAAVAELLHTAGVSFAVLGNSESCTGDPARRAGNEILFQMLARAAIDTLHEAKAQRIVVTCAHCFNTIASEFPELGGHFEVIHHTQLLNRLVKEGKLTPVAPPESERQVITYHDPCFLGRHNRVFAAPRELLGDLPGVEVREMVRNREAAMCCGAGGARAWMEEARGVRIAKTRMNEAAGTGASIVATACPFCTQMLGSVGSIRDEDEAGAGALADEEPKYVHPPQVRDVSLLLLESVKRGQ